MFECMKFNEATYWPSNEPKPYIDYSLRAADADNIVDLYRWIKEELFRAPVLLYCDEKDYQFYSDNVRPSYPIRKRFDFKVLTKLDKPDHKGIHEFILATTEEEMRGIDLRAPNKGVTLVLAKSFSC